MGQAGGSVAGALIGGPSIGISEEITALVRGKRGADDSVDELERGRKDSV